MANTHIEKMINITVISKMQIKYYIPIKMLQLKRLSHVPVALACNPSYSGGRDQD
jgi:hypothetical protein